MDALKILYNEQHNTTEEAWFWLYETQKNFDSKMGSMIQGIMHDLQGKGYFTVAHAQTVRKYAKLGRAPENNGKERTELHQWDAVMDFLDPIYAREKIVKALILIK